MDKILPVFIFQDDESGYFDWIAKNPDGYVVNTRRVLDPDYLVLHRASCLTVQTHRNIENNPGGFTERGYQKLCAPSVDDLNSYLVDTTGNQKPFTKRCSRCMGNAE